MATLPRDFDDSSNQLEEGKIHDILQQCGRMAYSCFNWVVTTNNYNELATREATYIHEYGGFFEVF